MSKPIIKNSEKSSETKRTLAFHSCRALSSVRTPLLLFAVTLISFSLYLFFQRNIAINQVVPPPNPEIVVTEDIDEPEEKKPDLEAEYIVPSDHPRRLIIEQLGVSGFIQKVGINSKNEIAVPSNIHIAGWFVDSVLPGQSGLSIIDGHLGGYYSKGIFWDLHKLDRGMYITIEFGDLSKKIFKVVEIRQLPTKESASILFEHKMNIEKQLNLVTCGGSYDEKNETYEDRIIIVTELVEEKISSL